MAYPPTPFTAHDIVLDDGSETQPFWIQKEYLIQSIRDAGFPMVVEPFDQFDTNIAAEMTSASPKHPNRGMFVGVKKPRPGLML